MHTNKSTNEYQGLRGSFFFFFLFRGYVSSFFMGGYQVF